MDQFGAILRDLRLRANLGLRRFAELIGIKPSNLSDIENGRRNPPSDPDKLREIAGTLGLAEDSEEWRRLFDAATMKRDPQAARRPSMRPTGSLSSLLRTIDNLQLEDEDISRLIADIEARPRTTEHAG